MALVIRGQTRCVICGQILPENEDLVSLTAFTLNVQDRLSRFNDVAVHAKCCAASADAQEALRWSEAFTSTHGLGERRCRSCQEVIVDWRDYMGFGLLTSDPQSPLSEFNLVQIHRSHVHEWPDAARVLGTLKEQRSKGVVGGAGIDLLIDELRSLAWG